MNGHFDLILQISALSLVYSFLIVLLQKKLIYTPEYLQHSRMASELSKKIMEARRRGDEDTIKKLEKRYEMAIRQTMKTSVRLFGLMLVFIALFWLFLYVLRPLYGNLGSFVRIAFSIPFVYGDEVDAVAWFIISSFLFIRLLSRILKMY